MRNNILILSFLLISQIGFGQKTKIDSALKVEESKLKVKIGNQEFLIGTSADNKNIDSLVVKFVKFGGGPGIKLIIADSIISKAYFWADFGKFDGKNDIDYELKYYALSLNKTNFKIGDTLMGKIEFLTTPIEHLKKKPELYFNGEIMHIIGTNIRLVGRTRTVYEN